MSEYVSHLFFSLLLAFICHNFLPVSSSSLFHSFLRPSFRVYLFCFVSVPFASFVLFVSISYICLLAKCLFDSPLSCFILFLSFTFHLSLSFHLIPPSFFYFTFYLLIFSCLLYCHNHTRSPFQIFSHISLASKFIYNKVYSFHKNTHARTLLLFSGNFSVSQES